MSPQVPLTLKIRAGIAVAAIPPLLSLFSFRRLCNWLESSPRPAEPPSINPPALAAWVDRLLYALPGPWRHTCLKRSTILFYLFRRAGLPVELCIGVDRGPAGALTAHAWLVCDGVPYLEREQSPSASHTPIARFPEHRESTT